MAPPRISAVLIAQNEAEHIGAAVRSVAWADEVLVVDGGSGDDTVSLATEAGARVVNRPFDGFVQQKQFAVSQATHSWIFSLDADERCSEELASEIQTLRDDGFSHVGFRVPRLTYYLGQPIRTTDWYPDRQLRLFHRERGQWSGRLVHESVRVDGPTAALRGEILHHPYDSLRDHLAKLNRYTSLAAEQMWDEGRRASLLHCLGLPPIVFAKNYLLKRGLMSGGLGLVVSSMNALYVFLKYLKLWELGRARRG